MNKQEKIAAIQKHFTFPNVHTQRQHQMSEKALLHWEEMWSDFKLFTQVLDVGKKSEF